MLSVNIDPHKRGVLSEKMKFWKFLKKNEFFEVDDLFVFCLPSQVSKREDRIGNYIFKNRAVKHVPQVSVYKNTTIYVVVLIRGHIGGSETLNHLEQFNCGRKCCIRRP